MEQYNADRAMKILQITYTMHKITSQQKPQTHGRCKGMKGRDYMFLAGVNNLNAKGGPVKMSEVAEFFQVTPAAISQIMSRLEDCGQVKRTTTKEDRRSVFVSMTPEGKETLANDEAVKQTMIQDLLEYLGDEDADDLIRLLERVLSYFEKVKEEKEK